MMSHQVLRYLFFYYDNNAGGAILILNGGARGYPRLL